MIKVFAIAHPHHFREATPPVRFTVTTQNSTDMETLVKYEVKQMKWPAKTFITRRATKPFDQLPAFFGESYGEIYGALQKSGTPPHDMPCAFYYSIDEAKKETDFAAAVPVQGEVPAIKGYERVTLPATDVITTTHYGSYESMGPAYEALEKYLASHSLKRTLIMEEYFSDPEKEKDPANWKTKIYFLVEKQ